MPTDFDPYLSWLDIPPEEQPPTHYRLLGLEPFENDPEKIGESVIHLVSRLQDLSHGENIESAQKLLNDVAKAKLCLTSKAAKFKYDVQLRKQLKSVGTPAAAPPPVLSPQAAGPPANGSDHAKVSVANGSTPRPKTAKTAER